MVGIHSHRFWSKKQGLINFMKIFTFKDYSFNIFKKKNTNETNNTTNNNTKIGFSV